MNCYIYNGPVMLFGKCIAMKWYGETFAKTEAQARNNLAYRFKKENNMGATAKVKLPGELTKEE